jgi:hypothetical protein
MQLACASMMPAKCIGPSARTERGPQDDKMLGGDDER